MENFSQSQTTASNEWERIRLEFIAEHEAGNCPTLDAFAARHPRYVSELTDFILDYLQMENAITRREAQEALSSNIQETPAPYAVKVWEKTLASLGIQTGHVLAQTAPFTSLSVPATLNEVRKAQNWSPRTLAQLLQIPISVVLKLQRGLISTWPPELAQRLAAVLKIAISEADAILQATQNTPRPVAAAFSAQGEPETAAIIQKQGQSMTFEEAMAEETLTAAEKQAWHLT